MTRLQKINYRSVNNFFSKNYFNNIRSIAPSQLLIVSVFLIYCFLFSQNLLAQKKQAAPNKSFWAIPDDYKPKRALAVSGLAAASYSTAMYSLSNFWYSQYEQSAFHFYNDNGEWNQMDKAGHVWTTYAESMYMTGIYRWTGMKDKKAVWIGGLLGWSFQASIEVLDGFSERWGASPGDLIANTAGSALFISQELLWQEQKFQLKFSSHFNSYDEFDPAVKERVDNLYGTSYSEKLLKDYNAQTYWLSFNPFHLKKDSQSKFPKWLNVSLGYGANNIFGGFENTWENEGQMFDRTFLPRERQYYLSLDIDWSKIKTRYKFVNVLIKSLNIFKFPAPALRINSNGDSRFHLIYF